MENVVMMLRELRESVEDMVNDGELCDFSKRHENLVMFIKERIKHHVFPPAQVGSRTAGLAEKCHCALHQMRLETMSFSEVQQLIGIYFSNTGDRGTEKAVNTMNILVDEFSRTGIEKERGKKTSQISRLSKPWSQPFSLSITCCSFQGPST